LPKKVLVLRQQKFASIISLAGHIHNKNLRVLPKKRSQVASIFLVLLAKNSLSEVFANGTKRQVTHTVKNLEHCNFYEGFCHNI
jgi:hypothetical protein